MPAIDHIVPGFDRIVPWFNHIVPWFDHIRPALVCILRAGWGRCGRRRARPRLSARFSVTTRWVPPLHVSVVASELLLLALPSFAPLPRPLLLLHPV